MNTESMSGIDVARYAGKERASIVPTSIEIISSETATLLNRVIARHNSAEHAPSDTLAEKLFDACADAKIAYAQLAVHLPSTLKVKLFGQLDLIHDEEDWEDGEAPINKRSLATFLRWFYLYEPDRLPNFGLTTEGALVASWLANSNQDKLILEFEGQDHIKWYLEKIFDDDVDRASGTTSLKRIQGVIAPYAPQAWFAVVTE